MDPAVNEQYYLLVAAKLRETAAHVIAMSVLVLNLRKIQRALLRMLAYLLEILAQNKNWALVQWTLIISPHMKESNWIDWEIELI